MNFACPATQSMTNQYFAIDNLSHFFDFFPSIRDWWGVVEKGVNDLLFYFV
jgi:hypothetical protein